MRTGNVRNKSIHDKKTQLITVEMYQRRHLLRSKCKKKTRTGTLWLSHRRMHVITHTQPSTALTTVTADKISSTKSSPLCQCRDDLLLTFFLIWFSHPSSRGMIWELATDILDVVACCYIDSTLGWRSLQYLIRSLLTMLPCLFVLGLTRPTWRRRRAE